MRAAHLMSVVFNPMTNPVIAFSLLLSAKHAIDTGRIVLIIVVAIAFASIIPSAYVVWLWQAGGVPTMDIDEKRKRMRPLIVGILSYVIGYLLLLWLDAPNLAVGLMFCYITNTLLVLTITRWWKISIHAAGVSGPLVALSYQFGVVVLPFYALVILVGASRVILGKHTPGQVIAGALGGIALTAFQLNLLFL